MKGKYTSYTADIDGPESAQKEFTIEGPFHGPDYTKDPDFDLEDGTPADARNIDPLLGLLQTRPGYVFRHRFDEFVASGDAVTNRHSFNPTPPSDRSLQFVIVRPSISATKTDGTQTGADLINKSDAICVGKWYTQDALFTPTFGNPPSDANGDWLHQRYKIVSLSGVGDFTNTQSVVLTTTTAADLKQFHLVGGYIRPLNGLYSVFGKIASVEPATNSIRLTAGWTGATSLASQYIVFLPIVDDGLTHESGPWFKYGTDFVAIPNTDGLVAAGGATVLDSPGTNPEYSRIVTPAAYPERAQWTAFTPGMSFRFLSENEETLHGIIRKIDIGGGQFHLYVWPRYSAPPAGNQPCEGMGRQQYYVAGSGGGTGVSPGANPVYWQDARDRTAYVANCCAVFADRLIIGSDKGFDLFNISTVTEVPVSHPGRVAWTMFKQYHRFVGPGAGFADLKIGPILWMFVQRDTLFLISQSAIIPARRTGDPLRPISFGDPIVEGKNFLPWAKPTSVRGIGHVIFGSDEIYIFDGSSLRPITNNLGEYYRYIAATDTPYSLPTHVYYEHERGRVFASRGGNVSSGGIASVDVPTVVGDLSTGEWVLYDPPLANIGGYAEWNNTPGFSLAGTRTVDIECLTHTTGLYSDVTGARDDIYSLQWSMQYDEITPSLTPRSIGWSWKSGGIDMQMPRHFKTITRIRIAYMTTSLASLPVTITIRTNGENNAFLTTTGTIDLAGTVLGEMGEAYFTGVAPAASGTAFPLSGYDFEIELSQQSAPAAGVRPVIRQIGIYFYAQMEQRL